MDIARIPWCCGEVDLASHLISRKTRARPETRDNDPKKSDDRQKKSIRILNVFNLRDAV